MRILRTTFTLALLTLHVAVVQAQVEVQVGVSCPFGVSDWSHAAADTAVTIQTDPAGNCSFDFGPNGLRGTASASAGGFANFTTQKASGGAISTGSGGATARTKITTYDAISINVPEYVGRVAVTYGIFISGNLNVNWDPVPEEAHFLGHSYSAFSLRSQFIGGLSLLGNDSGLRLDASRFVDRNGREESDLINGSTAGSVFGLHWITTSLQANHGETYYVELDATARSSADLVSWSGGNGYSDYVLGNSVYWAGIKSVTTPDGVPLDFTVSSASGTDYSRSYVPVPEPATALLMALGLTALCARRGAARISAGLGAIGDFARVLLPSWKR